MLRPYLLGIFRELIRFLTFSAYTSTYLVEILRMIIVIIIIIIIIIIKMKCYSSLKS
jgi:hypothetical protein